MIKEPRNTQEFIENNENTNEGVSTLEDEVELEVHEDLPNTVSNLDAEVEHDVEENVPNAVQTFDEDPSCFISPLLFKHCPMGPGRPPKKCEGASIIKKAVKRTLDNDDKEEDQPPLKRRGRPKGSKNKASDTSKPMAKKVTLKTRAESSADPEHDEETFYDSGDICDICEFPFNHPLKIDKPKMKCRSCFKSVHIPRYLKSGCTCTW